MNEDTVSKLIPNWLLQSATYSMVVTDMEGRYLLVNELFKQRFAFMEIDFVGQPFEVTIHPKDVAMANQAALACIMSPGKSVTVQLRKPDSANNDFYWTHWEFTLLQDPHGQPLGILCVGHDITATEKASKLAREFARKVDTIINEITDGFYQLDREWRFVKTNKVAEELLGHTSEALLGNSIWELFPETTGYNYPRAFRKAMEQNVSVTFEDYRPDLGQWFSVVAYPSVEGLTVFFKDVSREKQYIEQIKYQEYMLRAIYQSTSEASSFLDTNFIIRYNNQVAQDITQQVFGRKAKPGDYSLDFILPVYREAFEGYYKRVLKGESIVVERPEGENWWQISLFPVYNEHGQEIIGIAHTVQDITTRKKKEVQLKEHEQQLQKTLEAIPHPLLIVDEGMCIQYVNEEFERVFGFHTLEVLGRHVDFLIPERYRARHRLHQQRYLQEDRQSMRMGRFLPAITKSGKEIVNDVSLNNFTLNGKKSVIVILQDVTEVKESQDTIIRQNQALQAIAWDYSHKLRAPVSRILGLCEMMKHHDSETEEEKEVFLDYMIQTVQELDAIVYQIVEETNDRS
jgi:PAS domain S-box-containing protein